MKISYSILVHNEDKTLEKLLKFLVKWKDPNDEIVILDDYSDNEKTKQILDFYVSAHDMVYEQRSLQGDFASQKNYLKSKQDTIDNASTCLLYTSPSPRDVEESRMPSSA